MPKQPTDDELEALAYALAAAQDAVNRRRSISHTRKVVAAVLHIANTVDLLDNDGLTDRHVDQVTAIFHSKHGSLL